MKYSDQIAVWLASFGYDTFYFVGGGNIMHLTESLDRHLSGIPVVHEVAAVIAAEYHNHLVGAEKALALVTAGPGITNAITGLAGAYLESRNVLVIGGQVKTSDLSYGKVRQNGIQEIDGVALCKPLTRMSVRLDSPVGKQRFREFSVGELGARKAPVFIEIPLDVQACDYVVDSEVDALDRPNSGLMYQESDLDRISALLEKAERPIFLMGGGTTSSSAECLEKFAIRHSIPVATTWNGADLIPYESDVYAGRPNTWGQRSANIIIQQADLLISFGSRLGLQQTGFNWESFLPAGQLICIELDQAELEKGHPKIDFPILGDCNEYIEGLAKRAPPRRWDEWLNFCQRVRRLIPLVEEDVNTDFPGFIAPQRFVNALSAVMRPDDVLIPCSSGSAFTTAMQCFQQKRGQRIITNKGLASMGYGLAGAIGAAIASEARTILLEGDGGFSQNLQELGTVSAQRLNIKIFIFDDSGHASIRMTQKNYFGGRYVGCDRDTFLGLPQWLNIGSLWDIDVMRINNLSQLDTLEFTELFERDGPAIFILSICPDQTYFPKIASRVLPNGSMESNPIHAMTPSLPDVIANDVFIYIDAPTI